MSLAVTSLGMITSVGYNVRTSCASMRARITRPKEISYFQMVGDDQGETMPLIGYPIRNYTEGFNITGLWIRLARMCLKDLINFGKLPPKSETKFWEKTKLIGVTPFINDDRFQSNPDCTPDYLKEAFLHRLCEFSEFPIKRENLDIICVSHAGTISAIKQAELEIMDSGFERVIILAIDSYLDPLTLEWLSQYKRLKMEDNPMGIIPGEAGACFMIESLESCKKRGSKADAFIKSAVIGIEQNNYFTGKLNRGISLAQVIRETFTNIHLEKPFEGDLISDLNGENWKSYELGSARVNLQDILSSEIRLILPSESLGETGAASGAISICVAIQSLHRHYSKADRVLITSSSDYGQVGSVIISNNSN